MTRPRRKLPRSASLLRSFAAIVLGVAVLGGTANAQRIPAGPTYAPAGTIPVINVGGNYMEAQFARVDFAQKILDEQNAQAKKQADDNQKLIASGTVSALDLQAPRGAVHEFNTAANLLREQKSQDALVHLEKALKRYNKFVSAHNDLGLVYEDLGDDQQAQAEFETAAKLDPKFAASFVNLGRLELSHNDYEHAAAQFDTAAALRPRDAGVLTLLAYAQQGTHNYRHAIATAERVHGLDHKGLANIHYVAAAAAIALKDMPTVKRELDLFVQEDPANPLAPAARQNLEILAGNDARVPSSSVPHATAQQEVQTFPDSDRLKAQLASLGDESGDDDCADCDADASGAPTASQPTVSTAHSARGFTFHANVDEVAVFFAALSHGHSVLDLTADDVKVLDANKPPAKLLQFTPQSQVPLRLGLLIDTSGSIQQRFAFEKSAAEKFVTKMMSNPEDLAFVAGFSGTPQIVQDFTSDLQTLSAGIQKLHEEGGTALFDAVSYACWKLAAYPEQERVANVLVVLTDGEDNSSRASMKQVIRDAETTGVTVYTISTSVHTGPRTDADKVLIQLAERSGGEALFPDNFTYLGHTFDKLHDIIRNRYLVAYRPADFVPDGSYRPIRIVAERGGHRLQVRARKGYHARLAR